MSNVNLQQFFNSTKKVLIKHGPEILTGLGLAGLIGAGVMIATDATPKALTILDDEWEKRNPNETEQPSVRELPKEFTPKEIVKLTWKCYIPAVITCTVSSACIIGASAVNYKRNAALATAYTLSEAALKEYQEKVIETVGEKKEKEIKDKVSQERLNKNPVTNNEVIVTGRGETLCYDVHSGRYFRFDIDKLKRVENELNHRLLSEHYIALNELYYELGLPCNGAGNDLGWNIEDGMMDIHLSSHLAEDNTPCLVIDYHVAPKYDYRNLL